MKMLVMLFGWVFMVGHDGNKVVNKFSKGIADYLAADLMVRALKELTCAVHSAAWCRQGLQMADGTPE